MKRDVNLLPQSYCRRQTARVWLVQWGAAWLAFALVIGGVYGLRQRELQRDRTWLVALESDYAPLRKQASEVAKTKTLIEELTRHESLALALVDEQPMLTLVGVLSQAARQCEGEVSIQNLQLAPAPVQAGRTEPHAAVKLLSIKGVGAHNLAVARFVASLRDAQVFDAVGLTSAGGSARKDDPSYTYHVECTF